MQYISKITIENTEYQVKDNRLSGYYDKSQIDDMIGDIETLILES